jgi:diguanylate cyclase (GGDEF)-like protein
VGQGELDTQVEVDSQDEIGDLAAAFNNMVDSVRTNAERIMRRREELQALVNLSDTFLGSLDVDVALESALHEALTATQFEAGQAMLLTDAEDELVTRAEVGLSDELVGSRFPLNQLTVGGYCVLQRTTVQASDLDKETRFREAPTVRAMGVQSALAVPLVIGLRVIGAMVVYFRDVHDFQAEEVQLLQAIANQTASALERIELINDLSDSYDRTLEALVAALDARDKETEGHSRRIVAYTLALAKIYGVPEEDLEDIARGALLHDIGKIGVPDAILHKPAALSDAEWEVIRKHPEWGKQILEGIPFLELPAEMVLTHHERWDGGGYPQGLDGEEIPVGARLFSIVDAFDAITSNRPYRKASDFVTARAEILSQRGKQFDPHVVDIFMQFSEKDWQQVLHDDAIFQSPTGLKRATGELDPRQVALADHIQAMNKIVEAITSSLAIEDVLEKALESLVRETAVVGAGIFLHDVPSGELRYAADVLLPDQFKQSIDGVALGEMVERGLVEESGTRFCRDLRDIPALVIAEVADARPEWLTYYCIRLTVENGELGILVLFSERPHVFSADEQALFDRVGRLLAQALQNAQAHERVRHLAITDALTGAYNRHYFDDFLDIEVRRCARYGRPMSLLLLDMDDFKACNDQGGHQAGDQALKEVVRILNSGVRSVDMVARYGGEEFVVVLPETDHEGALEAAERLRGLIDDHDFSCGDLTTSIGMVSIDYLNGDSPDANELFARADKALFQAKQAGRNRVVVWSEDE